MDDLEKFVIKNNIINSINTECQAFFWVLGIKQ